jgi:hypothetical protein
MPDELFFGCHGLERALTCDADWIWLLAGGGVPRADALERLLEATALDGESPAALLSGTVVDATGAAIECRLPAADQQHPHLIRLVGKHALPIRATTFANCLVAAACFARHGLPDEARFGPYAGIEWSARALRNDIGYFIPSSVVSLEDLTSRRAALVALPALLRTFRSGALTRGDALHRLTASFATCRRG